MVKKLESIGVTGNQSREKKPKVKQFNLELSRKVIQWSPSELRGNASSAWSYPMSSHEMKAEV